MNQVSMYALVLILIGFAYVCVFFWIMLIAMIKFLFILHISSLNKFCNFLNLILISELNEIAPVLKIRGQFSKYPK
jgi:hypothetical protein